MTENDDTDLMRPKVTWNDVFRPEVSWKWL